MPQSYYFHAAAYVNCAAQAYTFFLLATTAFISYVLCNLWLYQATNFIGILPVLWLWCHAIGILKFWLKVNLLINNPGQNNWNKIEKSRKTGQEKKRLISTYTCFLTAIAKVAFLEERLGTGSYFHPNLSIS